MTVTKEGIKQELDTLNQEQLEEVADFIASIKFRTQTFEKTPQKRLSEFYSALPATVAYPGKQVIRQIVGETLAQRTRKES